MTSKERAGFRARANTLKPLFQVGKSAVTDTLIAETEDALKARELIKLKVLLDLCPETPREIADKLSAATGSDVIQVVGGSIVFYKYNPELHKETTDKKAKNKPNSKKKKLF